LEAETRRIKVRGQLRQKVNETHSQQIVVQRYVPIILAMWEAEIRRIVVPGHPGQKKKKVHKTPSQRIKSGCGGTHLSTQLGLQS
jgi:predicted ATPase